MIWRSGRIFFGFVTAYFLLAALLIWTTPLAPSEAKLFYAPVLTPASACARWLHSWIPGTAGLRLCSLGFGIFNVQLFSLLLEDYFDQVQDRRFTVMIFLLLPGVIASTVLLNDAVFALGFVLLFLVALRRGIFWLQLVAMGLLLLSATAAFAFFIAVAWHALERRDRRLAMLAVGMTAAALLFGHYDFTGKPRGHFLELLGVYAALFSPLFFIYYFYALYRTSLEGPRDLYWKIGFVSLVLSLVLSIRQQILIVDFSPYLLVGTMIPVAVYFRSLRVRMRRFQRPYRALGALVLATLFLSAALVVFHRPLYRALGSPPGFFASALYEPYDLAFRLRSRKKTCYSGVKKRYESILRFYGFLPCGR